LGLAQAIVELDAGLLVLGGKHHSAPARWFGGSTAHHAVRKIDKPILLTVADRPRIQRVLAAVDLSHAAVPTLKAAETFARLFDAELRVLHVVEPLPSVALPYTEFDATADVQQSTDGFNELLREETDGAQGVVRLGWAPALIREFVTEWDADLLVVGSHGKGWVDRILMGSTTEKLANHLPTSLLVVHIPGPNGGA
jgi:nucleotide-binding universal stress UspA family protein